MSMRTDTSTMTIIWWATPKRVGLLHVATNRIGGGLRRRSRLFRQCYRILSEITLLFNNPEWVKGERAVRLWRRMGGESRRWIMSFMWDVPDSLIEESLAEPRNWQISSRLEEYKKALQTVARMERLFAKGSEIKRKMRARAGLSD